MNAAPPRVMRPPALPLSEPIGAAFAQVEVFHDPKAVLAVWRELAPEKRATFYQTETFLLSWLDHFAAREQAQPYFVVARDREGAALALLPLGLFRLGPLRMAKFLGGKHSNYNLGLFRPGRAFGASELKALLQRAAQAAPLSPHFYDLRNMPRIWRGIANPLASLPHRPATSNAHATTLAGDGAAFLEQRLSADARKKLRKKERRLAAMGSLRAFRAGTAEEARRILDAFFAHKKGRPEFGLPPGELDAMRRLYDALTAFDGDGAPAVELHALALDEKIVATLAAGRHGARLQGMFTSYDRDIEIAKSSPGQILLAHIVRDACARNFASFDLGAGDMPYKTTFCDEVEPLIDAFYAPTWIGRLAQPAFFAISVATAALKRHPRLLDLAQKARACLSQWRG